MQPLSGTNLPCWRILPVFSRKRKRTRTMPADPTRRPPAWLSVFSFVPILVYFLVKYVVIGSANMTTRQSMFLLAFVVVAEIGLWRYRRSFVPKPNDDGTDS